MPPEEVVVALPVSLHVQRYGHDEGWGHGMYGLVFCRPQVGQYPQEGHGFSLNAFSSRDLLYEGRSPSTPEEEVVREGF